MKVALVHNFYSSANPSGENLVVDEDAALLKSVGIQVFPYFFRSDELISSMGPLRSARTALGVLHSREGTGNFARFVSEVEPDVLHVHNVFPRPSPAIVRTASRLGIPTCSTLHNYRRECVKGTFSRDGMQCTLCSGRRVGLPAIQHGCYRGSRLQSVPMVASLAMHRKTWGLIDRHIVLTPFQRDWLIAQGIDANKIVERPTPSKDFGAAPITLGRLLFVGRIDKEKGIEVLVRSWQASSLGRNGWKLAVAGEGPDLGALQARAVRDSSLEVLGKIDRDRVVEEMHRSAAVVVPSLTLEGFPRVVSEAFSCSRPVIALSNPNMDGIVGSCGWLAADEADLISVFERMTAAPEEVLERSNLARERFENELSASSGIQKLVKTYEGLL